MKSKLLLISLLVLPASAFAQLKVDYSGKVLVANTTTTDSKAVLTVGNSTISQSSTNNIGIAATVTPQAMKFNVGVEGAIQGQNDYNARNIGVRGMVNPYNNSYHGMNYGVCGIYNGSTPSYGGAGIYGSSSYTGYIQSPNIQGSYAGYFDGAVNVTGTLTVPSLVQTSDIRLKDNVELLREQEDGEQTLEKLLGMSVIQYNLKPRSKLELTDEALNELQDNHPEVLKDVEKREKEFSSQLHYGLSAQELQELYPNLVYEGQDGYLGINYAELVPILIRCIQELKAELDKVKEINIAKRAYGNSIEESYSDDASDNIQQVQLSYPISVDGKVIGTKRANKKK